MSRKPVVEAPTDETNGHVSAESQGSLTSAQRLAASATAAASAALSVDDPFGPDAKFFTEMRVLNREVSKIAGEVVVLCICLSDSDSFDTML